LIKVWIDGACLPKNPEGTACIGYVIKKKGKTLTKRYAVIGKGKGMTNNVAEYSALIRALKRIRKLELENEKVLVSSDSQLLVNQMQGNYKIKAKLLLPLYEKAKRLSKDIDLTLRWIPREENEEADRLTREAYQRHATH
jgi:ribonuclease HI